MIFFPFVLAKSIIIVSFIVSDESCICFCINIEIIHLAGTCIEELLVLTSEMCEHSSVVFSAIEFMMEQIRSLCFGGTIRTGQISFWMDFRILLFFNKTFFSCNI